MNGHCGGIRSNVTYYPQISDYYVCPTCGQGVFTTLGQHFCPGHRVATGISGYVTTTTANTLRPVRAARRAPAKSRRRS